MPGESGKRLFKFLMKKYDEETLLWIADLKVQKLLKEREIEHEVAILKTECGLSNIYVDECFLVGLRQAYYDLQEIEEELELAKTKRAEHLKKHPAKSFYSIYFDKPNDEK